MVKLLVASSEAGKAAKWVEKWVEMRAATMVEKKDSEWAALWVVHSAASKAEM